MCSAEKSKRRSTGASVLRRSDCFPDKKPARVCRSFALCLTVTGDVFLIFEYLAWLFFSADFSMKNVKQTSANLSPCMKICMLVAGQGSERYASGECGKGTGPLLGMGNCQGMSACNIASWAVQDELKQRIGGGTSQLWTGAHLFKAINSAFKWKADVLCLLVLTHEQEMSGPAIDRLHKPVNCDSKAGTKSQSGLSLHSLVYA